MIFTSFIFRNGVSNTKNGHTALLPVWLSFGKIFQIYIEMGNMQPKILPWIPDICRDTAKMSKPSLI
jgi:hypothetical protein